jgi:putative spermidine/putrescine transport system substrate-binding protein
MSRTTKLVTRRAALRGSLAAGLLPLAAPTVFAQSGRDRSVVFACYGGTLEQFTRNDIVPAFERATGIRMTLVIGTALSNFAKVSATRNNPEIDLYWSNELTHVAGKQQNLYDKLDPNVVTNIRDVIPIALDADGIGVASYVIATGFQYNSKAIADAGIPKPTSWDDMWDPRYRGRVALYNFSVAYSQDLLALLTRLRGGTERDVRPAIERLKQLRAMGNLTAFAASPAELDNMIVQGQSWITVNGSPRAFILKDRGAPVDFAYPKEGAGFFTNYFDPVRGARNPGAAQQLINFLISPEIQRVITIGAVAAPINRKVEVPENLKASIPWTDEIVSKMIRIDRAEMNRQLDSWAEMWNREIEMRRG